MGKVGPVNGWFGMIVAFVLATATVFAQGDAPFEREDHKDAIAPVMLRSDGPGVLFDERNDVDQSTLPADAIDPTAPGFSQQTTKSRRATTLSGETVFTGRFVSSTGRALVYRYSVPEGVDLTEPQPVLIYFHGNNTASMEGVLDSFFPSIANVAAEYGLMAVAAASPETRNPPQEQIRQWYDEDSLLLHEFLDQGLPDHYAVDFERIYFSGGSQGTCFLHDFMQRHGENYGGGFYGGCGCYNSPDPTWSPPENFKQDMKVFIKSTTGDFLLEHGWRGYAFYKYTIGLDTRGDLDQEGGHCVGHWSAMRTALDWFTGRTDIAEESFRPHWSRVNSSGDVSGLALDDMGGSWMVTREAGPSSGVLWFSDDLGDNWASVNRLSGTPGGRGGAITRNGGTLAAQNGMLFALQGGELRRSSDDGSSFQMIGPFDFTNRIVVDGQDAIYRDGDAGIQRSSDGGNSWSSFGVGSGWSLRNTDLVLDIDNPKIIARSNPGFILHLGSASGDSLQPMQDTPLGQPFQAAWDGETLWALARTEDSRYRLFNSTDEGASWQQIDLPGPVNDYWNFDSRVSALGRGRILIRGAWNSAWFSPDGGSTWDRFPGLETGDGGWITTRGEEVLFTDGQGVFRLELEED